MASRKTIGILTSGGDAPGMNAAIRSVVRTAIDNGMKVLGFERGYSGLINADVVYMNLRSVSGIINKGGTILYTARCPEFCTDEGVRIAKANCERLGIDGMVVIGGDGSFRGAKALGKMGIPCVCIPGTIDNDIGCSEYTIGFDTAMNTAVEMIDRLRDTAESHERCSVVEVMGRSCGDLALLTGIAVGATAIIVPEMPYDFQKNIVDRMRFTQKTGKQHFIIIVAEGIGEVNEIAKRIYDETSIETRMTVLGHVQRGGAPSLRDRVVASMMGARAVDIISKGDGNRVIAVKSGSIVDYDISQALSTKKAFDKDMYATALKISI